MPAQASTSRTHAGEPVPVQEVEQPQARSEVTFRSHTLSTSCFDDENRMQLRFLGIGSRALAFVHLYIVLWSFPHFYSSNIKKIATETITLKEQTHRWQAFVGGTRRLCYAALTKGFLLISGGAYIRQNSYELLPSALGVVLIVVGIFVLLDTYVILTYLDSISSSSSLHSFSDELLVEQAARILAIPVASIIWCLIIFAASLISYFGQTGGPQLDVGQDLDNSPTVHSHDAYARAQGAQESSSQPSPAILAPSLPLSAKLGIVLMVGALAVQFLSLLRNVTRSQNVVATVSDRETETIVATPESNDTSS